MIPAYAQLTREISAGDRRALAIKATLLATAVGFLILFLGDKLRANWQIGSADLLMTGGILLLIGALDAIKNAEHRPDAAEVLEAAGDAPASPIEGLVVGKPGVKELLNLCTEVLN